MKVGDTIKIGRSRYLVLKILKKRIRVRKFKSKEYKNSIKLSFEDIYEFEI